MLVHLGALRHPLLQRSYHLRKRPRKLIQGAYDTMARPVIHLVEVNGLCLVGFGLPKRAM